MGKIRILQVIGGNEIGGAEKHLLALARELNQDREHFSVHLVCLCHGPLQKEAERLEIPACTIAMRNALDLAVIPQLTKLMQRLNIAIVHTHGSRANLTARLAARRLGLPIVTTVHSSLAHDYRNPLAAQAALALDRITTPLAAKVITISDFLQREVRQRGAKNVVTIYNGIDPRDFQGINLVNHLRKEFGLTQEGPVIAAIGRLHPTKGQKYLLEAAAIVRSSHPNAKFLLVGSGPLEGELQQQAQQLGVAGSVIFTGHITQIEKVFAVTDIVCLPSLAEGMGLVLLEAMYFAKPVVATQVGGIPEVVKHGVNGMLVPPADPILLAAAIGRLLDDSTFAAKLGAAGQARFAQFSLPKMVERTGDVYKEILLQKTSQAL